MAGSTSRGAFPYPTGGDNWKTIRAAIQALADRAAAVAALYAETTAASRGSAGTSGKFHRATDTGALSLDTGTAFVGVPTDAVGVAYDSARLGNVLAALYAIRAQGLATLRGAASRAGKFHYGTDTGLLGYDDGTSWHDFQDKASADAAYKALTASGARAYRSAAYSAPNGSITAIPLDAESFDSGSLHDNSTNPSRITVPAAGRYQVTGNIRWAGSTLGTTRSALIYKNGVSVTDTATYANSPATTVSDVVTCAAGDYLELMSYQDSGVAVALTVGSPNTYFSVIYLGA